MDRRLRKILYARLAAAGAGRAGKAWERVIEDTEEYFERKGEPYKVRLVVLRFCEGWTEEKVREELNCSRSTYRKWLEEVLVEIAIRAAYRKLINPEIKTNA